MPDVGTLNITIQSDAEQAAKGLKELAGALSDVHKAAPNGLNLAGISGPLNKFAKAVKDNSKPLANIGTFLNAITNYKNAFKKLDGVKFNRQPIDDLKAAVGDGIKIGQAGTQINKLREALGGEWNTDNAEKASTALATIAKGAEEMKGKNLGKVAEGVSAVAKALEEYAVSATHIHQAIGNKQFGLSQEQRDQLEESARKQREWVEEGGFASGTPMPLNLTFFGGRRTKQVPGQVGMDLDGTMAKIQEVVNQISVTDAVVERITSHVSTATDKFSSFFESEKMISPLAMMTAQFREAEKTSLGYANAIGTILPKVNQHNSELMIEAGNARLAAMSEQALATVIAEAQGLLQRSRPAELLIQTEQIQSAEQFNIVLNETGDIVTSVLIPRFQEMYETWSMMAYEFGAFQMQAARLVGGDSPLLLGDGRTPGQLMLGDGTEAETFLSTWVQAGETFKTNWVDFTSDVAAQWRAMWSPDWILGGWQTPVSMSSFHLGQGDSPLLLGDGGVSPDEMLSTWIDTSEQWKQNWIVGEGTVSDAINDTQQVAAATREAAESAEDYGAKFASILEAKREEAELAERIRAQQEGSFYAVKPTVSMEQTNAMADNLTQLDLLQAKLREAEEKYNEYVNTLGAGSAKTIKAGLDVQNLRDAIWEYKQALEGCADGQEEVANSASWLSTAWEGLKGSMTRMFPTLTSLLKRFKSMMVMRSLRYVIRSISKGFSEGVQNVYQYSKAVGTSFAPAMDQAATALQQMKNSIGAAVAPVIQALIPVLQNVVNWVITGINYLNQFFALLNGQATWTRALPEAAEAFEKNTKAAKGSSKAMKDLLADWDELNIIQSNSGSGGGSGTGKTAEEYKNMFEEVNEFSDSVKNVLNFIDEHLGGLSNILKKAGIALLGWKFSKAFQGFLGTIGKLVAGGVIVSIGLDLAYGAAYDAGAKGYFDSQDILRAIIGGLATALGGSLITSALGIGGVWGFGIGLMAAAVITIVGYCQGEKDLKDANKWGNLTYTKEQIEEFVTKQFTFPVDAEIDVMDAHIRDEKDAKNKVDAAVTKFNNSLDEAERIVADIDTSKPEDKVAAVKQAATDAQEAIKALQELIDTNEKGLEWTLTNFTFTNENGEDISSALLESIKVSNKTLREYFTGVGEDLAKLIYEGEKSGWKNGEMEAALALMESQKRIYDRAEELQGKMKFETETSARLKKVVDKETANSIFDEQKQKLAEYEEKVKEVVNNEANNLIYLASLAESAAIEAGLDTEQGRALHDAAEKYKADAEAILTDIEGAVEDRLAETKAKMAADWADTLNTVYGPDMQNVANELFKGNDGPFAWLDQLFGIPTDADDWIEKLIQEGGYEGAGQKLYEAVAGGIKSVDPNGIVSFVLDDLKMPLWDFLSDDLRKSIVNTLKENTELDSEAYQLLMHMFKLNPEVAKQYIDPGYQDIWSETLSPKEPVEAPVEVEPEGVIDEKALYEQLKQEVVAALDDSKLDFSESMNLMTKYSDLGMNALQDVLDEIDVQLDEEGNLIRNRGRLQPAAIIAAGGMSTESGKLGGRVTPYTEPQTGTSMLATESMAGDVAKGTAQGNESQNELIQQLITIATRIANKDFTIKITPDSSWGAHNARSNRAYGMITGETQ